MTALLSRPRLPITLSKVALNPYRARPSPGGPFAVGRMAMQFSRLAFGMGLRHRSGKFVGHPQLLLQLHADFLRHRGNRLRRFFPAQKSEHAANSFLA
jgi:hypothetical protein